MLLLLLLRITHVHATEHVRLLTHLHLRLLSHLHLLLSHGLLLHEVHLTHGLRWLGEGAHLGLLLEGRLLGRWVAERGEAAHGD